MSVTKDFTKVLENFGISMETGFVQSDPVVKLPEQTFGIWNHVSETLADIIDAGTIRSLVDQMPQFDYKLIIDNNQASLKLAHLQLSSIAAAYVWSQGDQNLPNELPAQISVPLWSISNVLGLQPIICHTDLVLCNTKRIRSDEEPNLRNLKMLYAKFIPEDDIDAFFLITAEMELIFAKALPLMLNTFHAVQSDQRCLVISNMNEIASVILSLTKAFKQVFEHVRPAIFFNKIRPYVAGYAGKAFKDRGGLSFAGVDYTAPKALAGASAAQSCIYNALDAFLQIDHGSKEMAFIGCMNNYMLREHREFLIYLANHSHKCDLRGYVRQDPNTIDSYNSCIRALVKFRSDHIRLVALYVVNQASNSRLDQSMAKKPITKIGKFSSLDSEGTGGTEVVPFLKRIRDTTAQYMIE